MSTFRNWFRINALKRKAYGALEWAGLGGPTEPTYLVLGAHPSEGREYQSDEHYYTLNKIGEPAPRFILANLSNEVETDNLARLYKHYFDIILFDCSVLHFVINNGQTQVSKHRMLKTLLQNIIQMIKPGGVFFIDKRFERYMWHRRMTYNQFEEYKIHEDAQYMNVIRELNIPFHIQRVEEVMSENEVVRRVYEAPLSSGCFGPESELIVMPIPHATGGKRKSRRRQSKRNTTRRRRN